MDFISTLVTAVVGLFCLSVWLLPVILIAMSDKASGKERFAWILAVIFISWFAWIFYWLLAPIGQARYDYRYR